VAARISNRVLGVVFVIAAAATLMALVFLRALLRPVGLLASAVGRLGRGKVGEQVNADADDELGDLARAFNLMSRDLAATTVSRDFLDRIMSSLGDGVVVADRDGKIRLLNPAALALLGGDREGWMNVPVESLFEGTARDALAAARAKGGPVEFESALRREGGDLPVLCSAAALPERGSNAIVVTLKDISQRKRIELALARSNEELEQFAFVASHDLQEPLRKVAGFCQLLQRRYSEKLGPEGAQYVASAVEGSLRMRNLIADLLAFARIGREERPFAEVDVAEVVADTVATLQPVIAESGGKVSWGRLPRVQGDRVDLGRLFQNLLSNALKFRSERPPLVRIEARRAGPLWEFTVADNGIGIDPAFQDRLFVVFQRLHGRGRYPGTGIGLAICKKIAARHGGRIWVESRPGEGSTFHFTVSTRRPT
jgi:PAS domain S-box-containing protein